MLYEPTNIIPSTMTQTGTVAATTDNVNIQWQVNGNSAMTMFQIDVMQNNADSTFVYSTGVVTSNPTPAQGYSLPFYGKDRFGDYVQFVYQPVSTWTNWSGGEIVDGNNYKYRIMQFFQDNSVTYKLILTHDLAMSAYYFSCILNGQTKYVSFIVNNYAFFEEGSTVYYNFTHNMGWVQTTAAHHSRIETGITFSVSDAQPSGALLIEGATAVVSGDTFYNQFFTAQNSASSFITRTEPTLTITPLTENPVISASQNFTAIYTQEQGDNIKTVRWQLFNADDMSTPIDDTGDIFTSVLSYEYNGLFDGQSYSVICTVTTESGVSVSATLDFSVQYEQGAYTGNFTAQSLCHEDANLLMWDGVEAFPGTDNPSGAAKVIDGQLILPKDSTVEWNQKQNGDGETENIDFQTPWTVGWKCGLGKIDVTKMGDILRNGSSMGNAVTCAEFSPNGKLLVLGGKFTGYASLFSVSDEGTITFVSNIQKGDASLDGEVSCIAFNNSGTLLVLSGKFTNEVAYFTVSESNVTYINDVLKNNENLGGTINAMSFSYEDKYLVVGGTFTGKACLFSVENNAIIYKEDLLIDNSPISGTVNFTVFHPNKNILVIGGNISNKTAIFSIANTGDSSYMGFLTISGGSPLIVSDCAAFHPKGKVFVCSASFFVTGFYVFSIDENGVFNYIGAKNFPETNTVVGVSNIKFDSQGDSVVFSVTNGYLGLPRALIYSVIGDSFSYANGTSSNVSLFSGLNAIAINPISNMLVLTSSEAADNYATVWNLDIYSQSGIMVGIYPAGITLNRAGEKIQLMQNEIVLGSCLINATFNDSVNVIVIAFNSQNLYVYSFYDNTYLGEQVTPLNYTQQNISSIQLNGAQRCDYLAVIDGNNEDFINNLSNPDYIPNWNNSDNYTVDLLADFNYGLDGGTATATGTGFRLYRRTADGTENIELATLPSTTIALRDYGIKSNESYIYDFYVYDANGAFMGVRSTEATPLKRQFKRFSLLSTQYNENDNCYHVVKEYQFSCNIQDMAVSNNSNKSYVQNFTPYPTVFQSTANYASGTLQALIGFVDPKAYKYWDSTQLMDELNALSTTSNTLFLKDMKGHLWMVDVGTVQMTATQTTREMQVTISLPWTEIGDASDVSIIQTPDDEGWNTDAQVLDVKLDVDVETGLLQVVYPFPYNGTAFYLVGVTPEGVVSAVQPLPSTASQPTDGQLKAFVRHR